jgi:hypothetical protein
MAQTAITISIDRCHLLAFCPDGVLTADVTRLLDLFQTLHLPAERFDQGYLDSNSLEKLVDRIGPPRVEKVKKVLLVCGSYLEEQVSFAVQYLLAKGYAVYLLRDLITVQSPGHEYIHDQRLLHAGAISTTTRQLLYEWIASESDETVRRRLNEISSA